MAVLNPYLQFDGNCEEAFGFYQSVFGGEFQYKGRFGDMPDEHSQGIPQEDRNKIMHVALQIRDTHILMGSDVIEGYGPPFVVGTNFSLSIGAESKQEADDLYAKLSAGGNASFPMDQAVWGDYFGMLVDKYGVNWMINFNEKYGL